MSLARRRDGAGPTEVAGDVVRSQIVIFPMNINLLLLLLLTRYDTVDKIRLPTKLFLEQTYYDNAVVKVEAMEEFEDRQNMTISEVSAGRGP